MRKTPYEIIKEKSSNLIPAYLVDFLPRKWEKLGDVLIVKFPECLKEYKVEIARIYADVLKCKSVLEDVGGIRGELRVPEFRLIYGDEDTETIHVENGIRFKLDPQKIMFSSGNKGERIRMATISKEGEVVVDMFAGIGYFSIPMAVYSRPERIYAIEKNPVAYRYLEENVVLNHVSDIVKPIFGDNRKVTPKGVADRVIMGYLKNPHLYLPYAIEALKGGGIIHYHEICPNELIPNRPVRRLKENAERYGMEVEIINIKRVKSFAPGVSHIVVDARLIR